MKKLIFFISTACLLVGFYAFTADSSSSATSVTAESKIEWIDWETAVERNKTDKKAFIVDVYTDWCGWCKRMDKTTFVDPKVVDYISKNYHAVKLDAESKKSISFNGHEFQWVEGGRNGVHTLAASLLDNRMSYPSFVYLNDKIERIMISPGFKQPEQIMPELTFAAEGHYANKSLEQFKQEYKK